MRVRTDRSLIRTAAQSVRYVVVDVVAPPAPQKKDRLPVNVALVLDRSGSMGGAKIRLAKEAVVAALRMLRPADRFSLVVYDNEIDVVVESTNATQEAVRNALSRLHDFDARGTTDLFGGWLRGCEQIAAHVKAESLGRCLFLTDGLANVGTTDQAEIGHHVAELRRRGVSTSTFGLGVDFNAELLESMADQGGGHFYVVETARQIPDLLTSELGEALEVTARNARIALSVGGLVGAEVVSGFRAERSGDELLVHLGDLMSDQEVQVVVALTFPTGAAGSDVSVQIAARVDGAELAPEAATCRWRFAGHDDNDRQARDRDVDRIVADQYAQRGRLEAVRRNSEGDYEGAGRVLAAIANRVRGYAGDDAELNRIASELLGHRELFSRTMVASDRMAHYSDGSSRLRSRDREGRSRRRR